MARSLPPLDSIGFAGGFVCRIGRQITYLSSEAEAFYRHCADGHTPDLFLSGLADADAREALSACPALWQDWLAAPEAQEVADILRLKTAAPPVLATLTVEAFGRTVSIALRHPPALRRAELQFGHLASSGEAETAFDIVPATEGGFLLVENKAVIKVCETLEAAYWQLVRALWQALHPEGMQALLLHAGAVAAAGRTAILAGPTGHGKSTLTAGLMARGYRAVSDDLVPLAGAVPEVLPVPFAMALREDVFGALSGRLPEARGAGVENRQGGERAHYLVAAKGARVEAPVDAGPLLFPDFDPGAEGLDAAVVDPVAALARLAETGAVFPDRLADLGGVLAWLERTERIALRYSNGAAAEGIVAELLGPAA